MIIGKDILIENKSTNTGENILFTQKLLEEKDISNMLHQGVINYIKEMGIKCTKLSN